MKKLIFLLCAVCTALILSGCSKKKADGREMLIGFSVSAMKDPFCVTLVEGAMQEALVKNCELSVVEAGGDVVKQMDDIEGLISKQIKALIVNPVDSAAIIPAVEAVRKAGIPVIAVGSGVIEESVTCQVEADNVLGAKMAAEYLLSLAGEGAEIAEIQGRPWCSVTIDRSNGFSRAVAAGKAKIAARLTATDRAESFSVTENLLQTNSRIAGIFAHNDETALGALEAADAAGKKIFVVGFDATDDAVSAVNDGRMAATVARQPLDMGRIAMQMAFKAAKGEKIPAFIPVVVTLVK